MTGASFQIEIETVSIRRLGAAFSELAMRMGDLSRPMDEIGAYLVSSTQHRFETGEGPGGRPWETSIRAREQGGRTLVDTRRLESSITYHATGKSVEVGTNVIYAGIHQFGGTIKAKAGKTIKFKVGGHWVQKDQVEIPERPFLGVDDHDAVEIEATIDRYLLGALPS